MPSGHRADFAVIHRQISELLEVGNVRYTKHARERSVVREIRTPNIEHAIRYGRIVWQRVSRRHPGPSYSIEGLTVEGVRVRCVVAIDHDFLVIVTVHRCR